MRKSLVSLFMSFITSEFVLMARSNRNHGGRRDGRPQRSQTRERLRDEVERRGGASAASSPAPQAADAGGGKEIIGPNNNIADDILKIDH